MAGSGASSGRTATDACVCVPLSMRHHTCRHQVAPNTVANFKKLAKQGYFDGQVCPAPILSPIPLPRPPTCHRDPRPLGRRVRELRRLPCPSTQHVPARARARTHTHKAFLSFAFALALVLALALVRLVDLSLVQEPNAWSDERVKSLGMVCCRLSTVSSKALSSRAATPTPRLAMAPTAL